MAIIVLSAERLLSLKFAFRVFRNWFQSDKHVSIFLSFKIAFSHLKVATWSCLSIVERFYSNLIIFSFFSKSFTKRMFRNVAKSFHFIIFNLFISFVTKTCLGRNFIILNVSFCSFCDLLLNSVLYSSP